MEDGVLWKAYKKIEKVGEGAFGDVFKAKHRQNGQIVAVKKIRIGKGRKEDGFDVSAINEIRMLQDLRHENVMTLYEVVSGHNGIALVFDFLQTDLEHIIKDRDPSKDPNAFDSFIVQITPEDVKAYMQMLLLGINECHSKFIMHRDIKPGNLLLSDDGTLKLGDFGLARTFGSPEMRFSPQAITRWYRPMELLLGAEQYGPACDMWSVGCVFAELLLRNPLFAHGGRADTDSDLLQMDRIVRCLGPPTDKDWPDWRHLRDSDKFQFRPLPGPALGAPAVRRWDQLRAELFRAAADDAVDLLSELLSYDPAQRPSAEKALQHPYFTRAPAPAPRATIALRVARLRDVKAAMAAAAAARAEARDPAPPAGAAAAAAAAAAETAAASAGAPAERAGDGGSTAAAAAAAAGQSSSRKDSISGASAKRRRADESPKYG